MELMRMKICIFGAGAIGGFLASYLSREKHEVSVVSRGANLEAFKKNGLTMNHADNTFTVNPIATADTQEVGPVDIIFITVKGPALRTIGLNIEPLLKNETQVVFAMNGIPWWYFYKANSGTKLENTHLDSVDPNGSIWNTINPKRALGCVVYPACEIEIPGVTDKPEVEESNEVELTAEQEADIKAKEEERLAHYHKYEDGTVDQPFLTPDTVKD